MNPSHWLIHDVWRRRQGAVDANGDATPLALQLIKCLVEHKHKHVRDAEGRDIMITAAMWTTSEPRVTDTYWLPGPSLQSPPRPTDFDSGRSPAMIHGAQRLIAPSTLRVWRVDFA